MADEQEHSHNDELLDGVAGGRWDDADTGWSVAGVGVVAGLAKYAAGRRGRTSLGQRLDRIDNGELRVSGTETNAGMRTTRYSDGSTSHDFHAGGRRVIFPDGVKYDEIPTAAGFVKRITEPSGYRRTIYPDGREEIFVPGKGLQVIQPDSSGGAKKQSGSPDLEASQEDDHETDVGDGAGTPNFDGDAVGE